MNRMAIFIDGAYVDKLLQREFDGVRIHFEHLAAHVSEGSDLLRVYYYHCLPYCGNPPTEEEQARLESKQRFFNAISRMEKHELRLGQLGWSGIDQQGRPVFTQKIVDILMAVDVMELSATGQIQQAVLVTGDSDFLPLVEKVKKLGVSVVLWHGPESTVHQDLWMACDVRNEITSAFIERIKR